VIVAPIAAWTVHMVALASLVQFVCEHPGWEWVMHALTVALALVCVACLAIAWRYARLPNGEDAGSTTANLRFLSHVGLAVAAVNLILIGAEGVVVLFVNACRKS
jgi:predicted MFS family arabinose efflux permease